VRRHRQQHAAAPRHLVIELPSELAPALIEHGAVQTGLLFHPVAVLFAISLGRLGHIAYLQILNADERAVLADRRGGFVQEVFAGVGDAGVNLLDALFRLLPVVAELDLAAHAALVAGQPLLVLLETVERHEETGVAQRGEPCNANVDADGASRRRQRLRDLALRLNRHAPLAARLAHGDVAYLTEHVPAVAITPPAQLGKKEAAVGLIAFDLFRVGVAESIAATLALEAREVGAFGEKIGVGFFQVLQRMLQRMTRRVLAPRRVKAIAPSGKVFRHRPIAEKNVAGLVIGFLHRQRLVVDEPARSKEAAHGALLRAVWHQFVLVGLSALHASMIVWSMRMDNDLRHQRHCVFLMHVHWVFVTTCRREVFTKEMLDDLRPMFASVCTDFEAELVACDGEDDHVHLLMHYPPRVAVPNLVNRLKGVSSRMIRKKNYRAFEKNDGAAPFGRPATLPVVAAAPPSQ
jgi:putative transposase